MATQRITNIANDGVELYTVTSDPNGVILAASGSVALRTDNGNVEVYLNENDLTAWATVPVVTSAGVLVIPEGSLNVASATTDAATGVVTAGLFLPVVYGVGATDTVLPARVGGWRVVDAYIVGGGAGGNVTVQTGAGVGITNAMTPGGAAGDVTRAVNVSLTTGTIASGGTVRVTGAGGTLAGTCFIRIEPR